VTSGNLDRLRSSGQGYLVGLKCNAWHYSK
jgi:hypothetical protein